MPDNPVNITNRRVYTITVIVDVDPLKMSPFRNTLSQNPNGPTFGNIRNQIWYAVRDGMREIARLSPEVISISDPEITQDDPSDIITG